jgi:nucleoid-associated protein YgaU
MPVGPFSRYRDLPVVAVAHQTRGATRSLPIRRRPAEVTGEGRRHRVSASDEVDLLARRFYGREDLYWLILDANGGRLPGAFTPGETLTIPPPDTATRVERPL